MKKRKSIPKFKSAENEAEFWRKHDSVDYVDWSQAKKINLPNLKPSTKTISLRLPEDLLNKIRSMANRNDVPYQSLIKLILTQAVANSQHLHR